MVGMTLLSEWQCAGRLAAMYLLAGLVVFPANATTKEVTAEPLQFTAVARSFNSFVAHRILQDAYAEHGIKIAITPLPAARALIMADRGQFDGVVQRTEAIESQTRDLLRVPVPLLHMDMVLVSKSPTLPAPVTTILQQGSVGIIRGVVLAEAAVSSANIQYATHPEHLLDMVCKERVEHGLIGRHSAMFSIRQFHLDGLHIHTPPVSRTPLYHYLHREHQHLLPGITATLNTMRESGKITQIVTHFVTSEEAEAAFSEFIQ